VGEGKLGLPVSVVIANKGHKVYGYDTDEKKLEKYRRGIPDTGSYEPHLSEQLDEARDSGNLVFCSTLEELWQSRPEIIFIAVPTPSKEDNSFDTSYVEDAMTKLENLLPYPEHHPVIAVISTVLPMTTRTRFAPLTSHPVVYNPFFIAMGTVVEDYKAPEFVLLGYDNPKDNPAMDTMIRFYSSIYEDEPVQPPLLHMTWENAEATKMLYNTIIGAKVIIGNTIMEMCHNIPYANCDVVVDAFEHATKRIIGSKYLRGGMGDGGECHPRDNRALDYLCNKLGISSNIFKFIMEARELQAGWLAYLLVNAKLPAVILGKRFKSNSNLTTDSASILVNTIATALGVETHYHDPMLNLEYYPSEPHVFLAAINEPWVANYPYPSGSTVLDVWRQFDKADIEMLKVRGVKYVPVGRSVGDEG
jgi:UDPglucose 6-dehydrogenase